MDLTRIKGYDDASQEAKDWFHLLPTETMERFWNTHSPNGDKTLQEVFELQSKAFDDYVGNIRAKKSIAPQPTPYYEPVPLPFAKRLKKLGFREPTRAFYLTKPLPYVPVGLCWERNNRRRDLNSQPDKLAGDVFVSAPSWEEAAKFLMKQLKKK